MQRSLVALVLLALALAMGACSAAGSAKSPEPTTEAAVTSADGAGAEEAPADELAGEELADVDAAARAFDAAERSLAPFAFAERDDEGENEAMGQTTPQPSTQPSPSGSTSLAAGQCPRACRALGSMVRSAERLCELTGRDDPRCHNVEQRLDRAREAVRRTCPACAL